MSQIELYKCCLCNGCKPANLVKGVKQGCNIVLVEPDSSEKHICRTCITEIRKQMSGIKEWIGAQTK